MQLLVVVQKNGLKPFCFAVSGGKPALTHCALAHVVTKVKKYQPLSGWAIFFDILFFNREGIVLKNRCSYRSSREALPHYCSSTNVAKRRIRCSR